VAWGPNGVRPAPAGYRAAKCRKTNVTRHTGRAPVHRTALSLRRHAASFSVFAHQWNSFAFTVRSKSFRKHPEWETLQLPRLQRRVVTPIDITSQLPVSRS